MFSSPGHVIVKPVSIQVMSDSVVIPLALLMPIPKLLLLDPGFCFADHVVNKTRPPQPHDTRAFGWFQIRCAPSARCAG